MRSARNRCRRNHRLSWARPQVAEEEFAVRVDGAQKCIALGVPSARKRVQPGFEARAVQRQRERAQAVGVGARGSSAFISSSVLPSGDSMTLFTVPVRARIPTARTGSSQDAEAAAVQRRADLRAAPMKPACRAVRAACGLPRTWTAGRRIREVGPASCEKSMSE